MPLAATPSTAASRIRTIRIMPTLPVRHPIALRPYDRMVRRAPTAGTPPAYAWYSRSRPLLMMVFWISLVPSPMSRNGASRISRSISNSLE